MWERNVNDVNRVAATAGTFFAWRTTAWTHSFDRLPSVSHTGTCLFRQSFHVTTRMTRLMHFLSLGCHFSTCVLLGVRQFTNGLTVWCGMQERVMDNIHPTSIATACRFIRQDETFEGQENRASAFTTRHRIGFTRILSIWKEGISLTWKYFYMICALLQLIRSLLMIPGLHVYTM